MDIARFKEITETQEEFEARELQRLVRAKAVDNRRTLDADFTAALADCKAAQMKLAQVPRALPRPLRALLWGVGAVLGMIVGVVAGSSIFMGFLFGAVVGAAAVEVWAHRVEQARERAMKLVAVARDRVEGLLPGGREREVRLRVANWLPPEYRLSGVSTNDRAPGVAAIERKLLRRL